MTASPSPRANGSILYNVCAWPRYLSVTARDEAAWINTCRIRPFTHEEAGLKPWIGPLPAEGEAPPRGYRRQVARLIGEMRARLPDGFRFRLPGEGLRRIRPDAFIFMGGRLAEFDGVMPGIMEEFLHAQETPRPIYLFGGLGGAAGVIARALCDAPRAPRPRELTLDFYLQQTGSNPLRDYRTMFQELRRGDPQPRPMFDRLWSVIREHRAGGLHALFRNGLSHEENRTLIATDNTFQAVRLAWKGMCKTLLT